MTNQEKIKVAAEVIDGLIEQDGKQRAFVGLNDGTVGVATDGEKGYNQLAYIMPASYTEGEDIAKAGNDLLGLSDSEAIAIVLSSF